MYVVQFSRYKAYFSQMSRLDFYTDPPHCKGKSNLTESQMHKFNASAPGAGCIKGEI